MADELFLAPGGERNLEQRPFSQLLYAAAVLSLLPAFRHLELAFSSVRHGCVCVHVQLLAQACLLSSTNLWDVCIPTIII